MPHIGELQAGQAELTKTVAAGGGGGGATDLAYTAGSTGGTVTSSTGTDATLTLADGTNAGLMAPGDFTKLGALPASFDEAVDDRVSSLLVAGSNVTLTYNDAANTLTIAATGGGGGSATITAATVSVPYGSRDYLATVTDAGVSGTSKIMLLPGFYASTDENEPAEADMTLEAAASGNFLVRLTAKGRESIGGVFKLQYMIG